MTGTSASLPLAVIGAGFSGTMAALQLLPRLRGRSILLCERGERFARGVAYGTDDDWHLLNVRATNMSAFPDRPDHFLAWLDAQPAEVTSRLHTTPAGTFVSRRTYGAYLTQLLSNAVAGPDGAARLILVPDEVVDLLPEDGGYRMELAGGLTHRVGGAVLALGNLRPADPGRGPWVADPWSTPFTEGLRETEPVVVIGSGLTMVDVALHLRHVGFGGPVVAISRRGLRPRPHAVTAPWPTPVLTDCERGSAARLLRRLRSEATRAAQAGVAWQSVVDALRPITSEIWQGLPPDQHDSFLRHARPWWDVHRHRMAPPVSEALRTMIASGFLSIRAGHIVDVASGEDAATLRYRPRGTRDIVTLAAQRVIDASNSVRPTRCGMPLVDRLIARGLVRVNRNGLGLDQSDDLALIGSDSDRTPRLWALGPLGQGSFWECVAVPDIRQQAARLATEASARL